MTNRSLPMRRDILHAAAAAGVVAALPTLAAGEPPPEVTKLRLVHAPALCLSPQYIAEELLHAEGFAQVEYVALATNTVTSSTSWAAPRVAAP